MRAVVVAPGPEFSVADVFNGWCTGLQECGVEVHRFNLHDHLNFYSNAQLEYGGELRKAFALDAAIEATFYNLQALLYRTWPDIIVMVSGLFFDEKLFDEMRRTRPHKLVMIHTESPYEDDRQARIAEHVDLNIVNDPTNIDRFPAGTLYVPHAYDPKVHHADGRTDEYDFSFVGTGYPSRIEFLEAVDYGDATVGLGGQWQRLAEGSPLAPYLLHHPEHCLDNDQTADLYRSSAMSANLYRGRDVREANAPDLTDGWAMGPREVELAATGTFFARDPRGEGDELFPMLPIITDPGELSDVIRWSRSHPLERQQAADAARAAVADRTFSSNAGRLLRSLGV